MDEICSSWASAFAAVLRTMISTRLAPGKRCPTHIDDVRRGPDHATVDIVDSDLGHHPDRWIDVRPERVSAQLRRARLASDARWPARPRSRSGPWVMARGRADRPSSGRSPAREGQPPGIGLPHMGQVDGGARRPGRRTAPASRPGAPDGAADQDHHPAAGRRAAPGRSSRSPCPGTDAAAEVHPVTRADRSGRPPGLGVPLLVPAAGRTRREGDMGRPTVRC